MAVTATREELDALLEAATAPTPALPPPKRVFNGELVRRFLSAYEIEPGGYLSIEVCALYQLYLAWETKLGERSTVVVQQQFTRTLREMGFERERPPLKSFERDRRVLLVDRASAPKLIAWEKEHPLGKEERSIFWPGWRRKRP